MDHPNLLRVTIKLGTRRIVRTRDFGLVVAIAILLGLIALRVPTYFTAENMKALSLQLTYVALPAIGMTMLMVAGYVDLSIGSVFSVIAVLGTELALKVGFALALVAVIALSCVIGLLNGYLVWRLSISPIIVTLAGLTFYQGLINVITSGQGSSDLLPGFTRYGAGTILGVPNLVTLLVVAAVLAGVFLSKTSGGLNVFAIGGSRKAAELAGIRVRRLVLALFTVNMAIVGVAALLDASRFGGVTPSQGVGLELSVLTAVVLGGVSFTGGEGSVIGTLLASALLTVVSSGLIAVGINAYWSDVVSGLLLLGAVAVNQITEEQRERYRRLVSLRAALNASLEQEYPSEAFAEAKES
jgi:ribose/xylose/arabinose/galactoside ABC-type transport system permease subunit